MSFKHKLEIGHYNCIIDCIQKQIDKLVDDKYSGDECMPIFTVSVLWRNADTQEIVLTCTHLGNSFSRVLFPIMDGFWGYDALGDIVESLYNQTM